MIRLHKQTIYEALGREPVHPFPARMSPEIAFETLRRAATPLRVLDPMMGSGTVLALARAEGHRAFGVDIDPLSVLISRVWTTAVDTRVVRSTAIRVLESARRTFAVLPQRAAYPRQADDETKQFVAYWFDGYARRQLTALASSIRRVSDPATRDVLWCAFSRLIIAKQSGASLALDLAHSRPHRSFTRAPTKPFDKFLWTIDRVAENCIDEREAGRGPATHAREGDARDLQLDDESIDLVLTSPPYLNAIDYLRASKFSLVWMGYGIAELRHRRRVSIGTEAGNHQWREDPLTRRVIGKLRLRPALPTRHVALLAQYVEDLQRALAEVARVLAPRGRAVYVVGENTVRGTYVRNSAIVVAAAEHAGLRLADKHVRQLPANRRYLPPPTRRRGAPLDGRMRREVVLAFTK